MIWYVLVYFKEIRRRSTEGSFSLADPARLWLNKQVREVKNKNTTRDGKHIWAAVTP